MPPTSRETILLRMYEFEHATTDKITAVVNPGHTPIFRMPFTLFDQENITELKQRIIPMTVLHKDKVIDPRTMGPLEIGPGNAIT